MLVEVATVGTLNDDSAYALPYIMTSLTPQDSYVSLKRNLQVQYLKSPSKLFTDK
jgi:hypothetical protein